jgi:hypothetical protein
MQARWKPLARLPFIHNQLVFVFDIFWNQSGNQPAIADLDIPLPPNPDNPCLY